MRSLFWGTWCRIHRHCIKRAKITDWLSWDGIIYFTVRDGDDDDGCYQIPARKFKKYIKSKLDYKYLSVAEKQ